MPTDQQKYIDGQTIERIKRLDVRARLVVEGFLTGQHKSPFNGFAVEFAGHREYVPGDDIRHIDWKVWSKTDRYYIKEYETETNVAATLIVDASKSMRYGEKSGKKWSKFDHAATAAAALAFLLQQQQDAVGLVTFSTQVDRHLPSSSHPSHMKRLLHELEQTQPDNKTDVGDVFPALAERLRNRGLVALFSDLFVDLKDLKAAFQQFRLRNNEVIVFHTLHADELRFPFTDNTLFRGLEVDAELQSDPRALRKSYLKIMDEFRDSMRNLCASQGIDYVLVDTDEPLDAVLASYLNFRKGARRRL